MGPLSFGNPAFVVVPSPFDRGPFVGNWGNNWEEEAKKKKIIRRADWEERKKKKKLFFPCFCLCLRIVFQVTLKLLYWQCEEAFDEEEQQHSLFFFLSFSTFLPVPPTTPSIFDESGDESKGVVGPFLLGDRIILRCIASGGWFHFKTARVSNLTKLYTLLWQEVPHRKSRGGVTVIWLIRLMKRPLATLCKMLWPSTTFRGVTWAPNSPVRPRTMTLPFRRRTRWRWIWNVSLLHCHVNRFICHIWIADWHAKREATKKWKSFSANLIQSVYVVYY